MKMYGAITLLLFFVSYGWSSTNSGDYLLIDGYLEPAGLSVDGKGVVITIDFAVRGDLVNEEPMVLEWEMIGKPTIDLTNPSFTFGPHRVIVERSSKSGDSRETDGYVSIQSKLAFNAIVLGQQLPDDRYITEFRANLLSSEAMPKKLASVQSSGQVLAVLLNAGSQDNRIARAQSLSALVDEVAGPFDNQFLIQKVESDSFGYTHARYDQYFKGVRVFGAQRIDHIDDVTGIIVNSTDSTRADLDIDIVPRLTEEDALDIVKNDLNPKGLFSHPPTAEVVIFMDNNVPRLAYHIRSELYNTIDQFTQMVHFVDAQTGVLLAKWPTARPAAVEGTGTTRWYGNVPLNTNSVSGGFQLKDLTRANSPFNRIYHYLYTNENNLYQDSDNTWGNSQSYNSANGPTSENGETAAADVAYAIQKSFDYFLTLGHDGQDGNGSRVRAAVHADYINGSAVGGLGFMVFRVNPDPATTVDIVGHEYTHGVTSATGDFNYTGEGAGLDEGTSNIFGAMIEFYARPATVDWIECAQVPALACGHQRLNKPSDQGDGSYDYWFNGIGVNTPHRVSGPARYFFYYLVNGVPTTGNFASPYLPTGNDPIAATFSGSRRRAAEIWLYALKNYVTPYTNYNGMRNATSNAAVALGYDWVKVRRAWLAVNVNAPQFAEPPCSGGECTPTVP